MEFTESLVEVGHIFQHLDTVDGVKLGGSVGERHDVLNVAFHPREIGAPLFCGPDLVFADVDCANPTTRTDTLCRFVRIESAAATDFERSFSRAEIQGIEDSAPTSSHVMTLSQSLLNAGHV
jgi:hypothetical protein